MVSRSDEATLSVVRPVFGVLVFGTSPEEATAPLRLRTEMDHSGSSAPTESEPIEVLSTDIWRRGCKLPQTWECPLSNLIFRASARIAAWVGGRVTHYKGMRPVP